MTPVSLMPPVDYCPSCEGRKAEANALDIAKASAERADLKAEQQTTEISPSPGAVGPETGTPSVTGVASPLVSPALAVQAMLDAPETNASFPQNGEAAALRLQAAEAYQAA